MRGQPRRGCAFANRLSSGRPNPFRVLRNIPRTQGSRVRQPWADGCNHFVVVRTKLLLYLPDLAALSQDRLNHSSTHYHSTTKATPWLLAEQCMSPGRDCRASQRPAVDLPTRIKKPPETPGARRSAQSRNILVQEAGQVRLAFRDAVAWGLHFVRSGTHILDGNFLPV